MGSKFSRVCGEGLVPRERHVLGGIVVCALSTGVVYVVLKHMYNRLKYEGEPDRTKLTRTDVVYLFIPPRIGVVSNISPFAVKLETWFRLSDIPYEVYETTLPSSKRQFPYIILNGTEIPDSRFIVEAVSEHFQKPVDPTLSPYDRALSVAFSRMMEESMFFSYMWYRVLHQFPEFWGLFTPENKGVLARKMLKYAPRGMTRFVALKLWHQGTGRHSPPEIYSLAETELKSLSDFLGNKEYFFGKEPTLLDCVAFGHLVQILWIKLNFPPRFYAMRECKNLLPFLERMRDRFYPDWTDLCNPTA